MTWRRSAFRVQQRSLRVGVFRDMPEAKDNSLSGGAATIEQIITFPCPQDRCHDLFQMYYVEALRRHVIAEGGRFDQRSLSAFPRIVRSLNRVRNSTRLEQVGGGRLIQRAASGLIHVLSGSRLPPSGIFHDAVGQYLFHLSDGGLRKVCIDSGDSGDIPSAPLLAWCDVYFKTNYWPSRVYDDKVKPLCNGNPLVLRGLGRLRSWRSVPSTYDFCFIVRVWGGRDDAEGIEHNLRLLEAVAKARCRKYLLAYLVAGDIAACGRRLERQGIPWTCQITPLEQLWEISARSRLNVIRLGMHGCIPWRMMDMLALGACPVLDQQPFTRWPQPLVEGEHYLSLGVTTPPGRWLGAAADYDAVTERMEAIVADETRTMHIREQTASYFDENLKPESLGQYLCRAVMDANSAVEGRTGKGMS